jgi:hypothetical protein
LREAACEPEARPWLDTASRFFRASYEGQFTPAADALREAGCQTALVLSAEDAQGLVDSIADSPIEFGDGPYVQCRTILPAAGDACAKMARIAARASDPTPSRLVVRVQGLGACSGVYTPDGAWIEAFDHAP